ncbi:Armadillo-type fold protein [Ophiocordyceps camponoti-floridani]|uniref:Armadillo-type fold protein n=1 Tax=Ophiocordyceps camponoti-floridani TaxID=2030778 RepID=A0A8H4VDK5_9HYPO|nr:Armadillo-type fold protein [Ophiocordyceps camponoti-floridani]
MEGPYPDLSLDEVQFLILSLYQPNSPQIIADAQACLSRFQCSSQAWTMIQDLLQCPDENVKFFGALTVIIKLNKESSALNNEDATELLIRLVGWYIRSLVHSDSPLVLRKLSSAIGTHFIHFHHLWPLYLRHIVLCLACGQSLNPIETREPNEFASALGGLCPRRLQAAVWVVTCVMEDASRIDLSAGNKSLYEAILRNVPEAEALVTKCLSSDSTLTAVSVDSLRCIQAWISFAQKSSSGLTHDTLSLRPLVEAVILSLSDKDTFEASAELLVDILTNCPLLLTSEHYDNLSKQFGALWAVELYRKLLRGDFDSESMQFGQLLLAFGEARTEALIQSNDEINNHILVVADEDAATHTGLRALKCLVSVGKGYQSPSDVTIDIESGNQQDEVIGDALPLIHDKLMGIIVQLQHTFPSSSEVMELVCSVFRLSLLRQLPDPGYDPELSQNGIELASRILARAPLVVIGLQPAEAAEFLLMFTIKVLDGKEPLPKGAAAEFWTAFVSLKSDDSNVEPAMRRAMQTLGPMLAQSLARNIGGNASRSELDKLSEPLKNQVTSEQKVLLVKKIISLRGSRATNQVIREFWLSSRGSNFAYAS